MSPWRSTAKKRALSPLSLWVKNQSSLTELDATPLDSSMAGSLKVRSGAAATARAASGASAGSLSPGTGS